MTVSGTATTTGETRPGRAAPTSGGSTVEPELVSWAMRHRDALELGCMGLALLVAYTLLFLDRTLGQYVDESDNLLGGQLVARGYRLYVDFFSQHMPLPYFVAALGSRLGLSDLIGYRVFFSVLVLLFFGYVCLQFRRRLSPVFLVVVVLTFGLGHPMFSGYMLLADHFFALALLLVLLFVLADDVDLELPAQVAVALCCFVAIQSTLISIYPLLLVATYYVIRKVSRHRRGGQSILWRREAGFMAILILPNLLLGAWLVVQGDATAFVDQAIRFNQTYYARYDLGGNPVAILVRSVSDFKDVAVQYLRPGAWREVETFLLVSNIAAVGVLWKRRDVLLALFYVGLVILSRMRGAGYHGSPYFLVSFASIALVLAFAAEEGVRIARGWWRGGRQRLVPARSLVGLVVLGYVGLAAIFYHDIAGFYVKLPRGVSDAADVETSYATVVEAVTDPTDRIWAAPFEPYVYLKSGRLPASAYWYYHPWLADDPRITDGVLRDLQAVQPPLVIFRADKDIPWVFPLPTPRAYGARVFALIRSAYSAVDEQDPVLRDVFVRNDRVDDARARLVARGMLKTPSVGSALDSARNQ